MGDEKELNEDDDLKGFAEVSDLDDIAGFDNFDDLGDLSDLGDIPDLSDLNLDDLASDDELAMEFDSLGKDEPEEEISVPDIDLASIEDEETDIPVPEEPAEAETEVPVPEDVSEESAEEISEVSEDVPEESAEEISEVSEDIPEELPQEEAADQTENVEEPAPDVSDIDLENLEADLDEDISLDSVLVDDPDIASPQFDVVYPEETEEAEPAEEVSEELDVPVLDDMMPEEASESEEPLALDDTPEEALTEDMPQETTPVDEPVLDDLAIEEPVSEETEEVSEEADALAADMALDAISDSGLDELGDEAAESSLDSMLEGIDMSDMLSDIPAAEEAEAASEPLAAEGLSADGYEDLMDMLGGEDAIPDALDDGSTSGEEGIDIPDMADMLPEKEQNKEEKKVGFFKRIFGNVVNDEIAEAERKQAEEEEEQAAAKAEEDAKKAEEKAAKDAKKAEEKAAKKAEKAAKKAEKAEAKAAKKAEKAAKKAEEEEALAQEVVGKLNKVGVSIVIAIGAIFLVIVIAGTNLFGNSSVKSDAERYFKLQKYNDAYNEVLGTDLKEKDPEQYNKIITVMKVQQSLNAYSSYKSMKRYPEALDALLKGLKNYEDTKDEAYALEIEDDMKACKNRVVSILKDEFSLSEQEAYAILRLDKEAYTEKVIKVSTSTTF